MTLSPNPELNYEPPVGLNHPHVQTILSSVLRKQLLLRRLDGFIQTGIADTLSVDGVNLRIHRHQQPAQQQAPTVALIPGWLGSSDSSYVLSAAANFWHAGYSVVRITLRDHGDTAALNQELFNSALIEEVVSLVGQLQSESHGPFGLVGFSLGGNFALRVAKWIENLPVLAIGPAIAPDETMRKIDANPIYQHYFMQKWRKTWAAKQAAFPGVYDFSSAMGINTVSALTDYFVRYHSEFSSTEAYFSEYDLRGTFLKDVRATILTAADDPIIPLHHFESLPKTLNISVTAKGGHTAYLKNWQLESWADEFMLGHFDAIFGRRHNL